jgi:hypothetical protein
MLLHLIFSLKRAMYFIEKLDDSLFMHLKITHIYLLIH